MNWAEAQQIVADGGADALIQINKTDARLKLYDFSVPLLDSKFSFFMTPQISGGFPGDNLHGMKVGVEPKGFPELILKTDPLMNLVAIPTILEGFRMLKEGKIDVVAVDEWVGQYILAIQGIQGIQVIGNPLSVQQSAIAVKKGNAELLGRIDAGLLKMRRDGTYSSIINKWQSKSIVFETVEQVHARAITQRAIIVGLLLFFALLIIVFLLRERAVRHRQVVELQWRSNLLDEVGDSIQVLDIKGNFVYMNESTCRNSGYRREELLGKSISILDDGKKNPELASRISEIESIGSKHFQTWRIRKDGSRYFVDVNARIFKIGNESLITVIDRDITEMKRIQDEAAEIALRFKTAFDNAPIGISLTEFDGKLPAVNQAFCHMLGYTMEEINKTDFMSITHPGDVVMSLDHTKKLHDGLFETTRFRKRYMHKDGHVVWVDISMSMMRNLLGEPQNFITQILDITDRVRAEDAVERHLHEKELILKEVHHRVKNNLNTIRSLLSLQARMQKEAAIITVLEDAGNRIQSMSLLYDKLYRSADFTNISVRDYLPALVDEVITNFPNSKSVKVLTHFEDIWLNARCLQPLGIIINELLTNIMKYAFIGRSDGLITVSAAISNVHITISVQDNGNGIPESVTFENSTGFGLQLVHALTQQLDGTIRIERGNGTKVVLELAM